MAFSRSIAVFALLVLCFAVAPSTQKFTLNVDDVFPNRGPTTEILALQAAFAQIGELDVSTLRVESDEGVTISGQGGFVLDGAAFGSSAGNVSVSTTLLDSEINVIGANALDFFGTTVDFSSANGAIDLSAQADFQFVGLGSFNAAVDNFASNGDNVAVEAAAGAISFTMTGDLTGSGSQLHVEGINGLSVAADGDFTLESTFNNVDINGNRVLFNSQSVAMFADRNNLVLAASKDLAASFDDITVDAAEGVRILSAESSINTNAERILLSATDGDMLMSGLQELSLAADDLTFTGVGATLLANAGLLGKIDVDVTLTAANLISAFSNNNFVVKAAGGNVELSSAGDIGVSGLDNVRVLAAGTAGFSSVGDISLSAVGGMYISAEQTIVYGSQLPVSTAFPIDVSADVVDLRGAAVSADVQNFSLSGTGASSTLRFQTFEFSRDSTIEFSADGAIDLSSSFVAVRGGDVSFTANGAVSLVADSFNFAANYDHGNGFTGTGDSITIDSTFLSFATFGNTDVTGDNLVVNAENIAFEAERDLKSAANLITFDSTSFLSTAENNQRIFSGGDLVIDADDALFIDTSGFAQFLSGGSIDIDAEESFDVGSSELYVSAGQEISLTAQDDIDLNADESIVFAGNNIIEADQVEIGDAGNVFILTPSGEPITLDTGTLGTDVDDVELVGFVINFEGGDVDLNSGDHLFVTNDSNPIALISEEDMLVDSASDLQFLPSDDLTFTANDIDIDGEAIDSDAVFDISYTVTNFDFSAGENLSFDGNTVEVDSAQITTVFAGASVLISAADVLELSSPAGPIDILAGGDFLVDPIAGVGPTFSITSTGGVALSALTDFTATTGDFEHNGGDYAIDSLTETTFSAGDEVNFAGDTVDHTIGNDLTSTSAGDTNISGENVVISAGNAATFNIGGDIFFNPNSPVTVNQEEVNPGSITATAATDGEFISNGHLHFGAGGAFGATSAFDADADDLSAIYVKAAARSAGISLASTDLTITSGGDVRFLVSDWATGQKDSNGGFDLNILNTDSGSFVSDFDAAANGGILITSDGSTYDPKTGRKAGVVLRGLDGTANFASASSSVDFVGQNDVYFEGASLQTTGNDAGTANTISSGNSDITFQNLGADISTTVGAAGSDIDLSANGWATLQGGVDGVTFDSAESLSLSSGTIEVQADLGKISFTQEGDAPLNAVTVGNTLFEAAGEFDWAFVGSVDFNSAGATPCPADDVDCNDVIFFGDDFLEITGDAAIFTAVDISLRSSLNNDITATHSDVVISGGSVALSGGEDTTISGAVTASTAAGDISFVSEGSIFVSGDDVTFTSLADQLFEADHSVFVDAETVIVGGTTSPIMNVYAGGLGREYGVEINSVGPVGFESEQDISIAAGGFRSFSPNSAVISSDAGVNIQSLGTGSLGNDIIFDSEENMAIDGDQLLLTASNILFEYDTNLDFVAADDLSITTRRLASFTSERTTDLGLGTFTLNARDVSVVSFLKDPVDAVTGDSTAATGNTNAQTWQATDVDFSSADDSTFSAAGGLYVTTPDFTIDTFASNSDITFETTGPNSDFLFTGRGTVDADATRIIFEATHRAVFGADGLVDVAIGDSITSFAQGKTIFAAAGDIDVSAERDFELTSTGRILAYNAGSGVGSFVADSTLTFDADHDIVFETTETNAANSPTNGVFVNVADDSTINVGRDFIVDAGEDITLTTEVYDLSINGVFADDEASPSVFDLPHGLFIGAFSSGEVDDDSDGDIFVQGTVFSLSARDDVVLESFGGAFVDVTGDLNVNAAGPLGFELSSPGPAGDAQINAGEGIFITADDTITFHATGDDFSTGVLFAAAGGIIDADELGLDDLTPFDVSMAFVSAEDSVTVAAEQGKVRFEMRDNGIPAQQALADFYVNPGVNGSLTFQSSGSTEDGLGFIAAAVGTYLISERNIRLEGANVRFTELGQDRYAPNFGALQYNYDFEDLQQTRATVYGYESQEWVALGAGTDGLAFDIESDVPFEGILLDSYFVNFQTGGGIVMTGADDFRVTAQQGIIGESAASIVLQGRARNEEDVGLLVSVGTSSPPSYGSARANFEANDELAINSAGSLLADAEALLYFSAGVGGDVTFDVDGGFTYQGGFIDANVADEVNFLTTGDLLFTSPTGGFQFTADEINITGQSTDGVSNISFGNPNFDTGTAGLDEYYYGQTVDGLTGNINISAASGLFINSAVVDVPSTAALILPEQSTVTCASIGSLYVVYNGPTASLCTCGDGGVDCVPFDAV